VVGNAIPIRFLQMCLRLDVLANRSNHILPHA